MTDNIKDLAELMTPLDDSTQEGNFTPVDESGAITMSFSDAIREVVRGNKIRRISWPSEEDHGTLREGWLEIFTNGKYHIWQVSDGDMEGNDWVIVK